MTAHLASIGPVGWAAIVVGSLIVFRLVSPSFRAARAFIDSCDPGEDEHVEWIEKLPPVPQPVDDGGLPAWLYDLPTQPLTQDEFDVSENLLRGAA